MIMFVLLCFSSVASSFFNIVYYSITSQRATQFGSSNEHRRIRQVLKVVSRRPSPAASTIAPLKRLVPFTPLLALKRPSASTMPEPEVKATFQALLDVVAHYDSEFDRI
jgi:hypothetical protein